MALVFTQTDLDALKEAFTSGALEVQIGDRRVKYQSQDALLKAISIVQQSLDGVSSDASDNPNMIQSKFSKGGS